MDYTPRPLAPPLVPSPRSPPPQEHGSTPIDVPGLKSVVIMYRPSLEALTYIMRGAKMIRQDIGLQQVDFSDINKFMLEVSVATMDTFKRSERARSGVTYGLGPENPLRMLNGDIAIAMREQRELRELLKHFFTHGPAVQGEPENVPGLAGSLSDSHSSSSSNIAAEENTFPSARDQGLAARNEDLRAQVQCLTEASERLAAGCERTTTDNEDVVMSKDNL
ncbi:hypothetical protein C7974DRAFT_476158 [Boeremia exigua]|uniref:uncharacterized protein n=1 Tax=Boeremia exigua TaxID=749465 RepID=UPI001E8E4CBF|nr:uncharacterized protein C7974DRAFT_476158 [Boeremia exigua]KAH6613059.1 hypothetical protein C7974DRAFT_476158 [Boeremia exigua]